MKGLLVILLFINMYLHQTFPNSGHTTTTNLFVLKIIDFMV